MNDAEHKRIHQYFRTVGNGVGENRIGQPLYIFVAQTEETSEHYSEKNGKYTADTDDIHQSAHTRVAFFATCEEQSAESQQYSVPDIRHNKPEEYRKENTYESVGVVFLIRRRRIHVGNELKLSDHLVVFHKSGYFFTRTRVFEGEIRCLRLFVNLFGYGLFFPLGNVRFERKGRSGFFKVDRILLFLLLEFKPVVIQFQVVVLAEQRQRIRRQLFFSFGQFFFLPFEFFNLFFGSDVVVEGTAHEIEFRKFGRNRLPLAVVANHEGHHAPVLLVQSFDNGQRAVFRNEILKTVNSARRD